MRFVKTDGYDQDLIQLCQELDDFLDEVVGGHNNREQYVPLNQLDCIHTAIVAYDAAIRR